MLLNLEKKQLPAEPHCDFRKSYVSHIQPETRWARIRPNKYFLLLFPTPATAPFTQSHRTAPHPPLNTVNLSPRSPRSRRSASPPSSRRHHSTFSNSTRNIFRQGNRGTFVGVLYQYLQNVCVLYRWIYPIIIILLRDGALLYQYFLKVCFICSWTSYRILSSYPKTGYYLRITGIIQVTSPTCLTRLHSTFSWWVIRPEIFGKRYMHEIWDLFWRQYFLKVCRFTSFI